MFNFSGLYYHILTYDLPAIVIGIIVVLFQKPWKPQQKKYRLVPIFILLIIVIIFTAIDVSHAINPSVSLYTGKFMYSNRTSRNASLPFTEKYVFWNGEGKKQPYKLDGFSKDEIFPSKESDW